MNCNAISHHLGIICIIYLFHYSVNRFILNFETKEQISSLQQSVHWNNFVLQTSFFAIAFPEEFFLFVFIVEAFSDFCYKFKKSFSFFILNCFNLNLLRVWFPHTNKCRISQMWMMFLENYFMSIKFIELVNKK